MELTIKKLPFGQRTNNFLPDNKLYEFLGESGIRKMVNDHYNLLAQSEIKHLFPADHEELNQAKTRSADFFVQRLGGPDYYEQHRGKPLLSRRHAPFKITPAGRITWLKCYREVLLNIDAPEEYIIPFWNWLNEFSNWMVNTLDKVDGFNVDNKPLT